MSDLDSTSRVKTDRLAQLSDCAKRLGRKEQADRFLLLAWQAYDEPDAPDEDLRSAA